MTLVASCPPTRLRARGGSGWGVIPLVGKEEGKGDEWRREGEGGFQKHGLFFAGQDERGGLFLQTTCGACRADATLRLLVGPPPAGRSGCFLTITTREWKFWKYLACL